MTPFHRRARLQLFLTLIAAGSSPANASRIAMAVPGDLLDMVALANNIDQHLLVGDFASVLEEILNFLASPAGQAFILELISIFSGTPIPTPAPAHGSTEYTAFVKEAVAAILGKLNAEPAPLAA